VRDQLVERWMMTTRANYAQDLKRVYYLSMEFLIGRTFTNALLAVDLYDTVREALADFGVNMDALAEREPDAALGNGGLGRLAACFLDSMATLGVPGMGYGIRYEYGMFRQRIIDGQQVETPDYWLTRGNPWEFQRPEVATTACASAAMCVAKAPTAPYGAADWSRHARRAGRGLRHHHSGLRHAGHQHAAAVVGPRHRAEIDLSAFNRGNYIGAVESKNQSENVSRVLYPDDSTPSGRELRLHQEYFFSQRQRAGPAAAPPAQPQASTTLSDRVSIHLNDTHPVLAVPS
jgi:starch phosphorylase